MPLDLTAGDLEKTSASIVFTKHKKQDIPIGMSCFLSSFRFPRTSVHVRVHKKNCCFLEIVVEACR